MQGKRTRARDSRGRPVPGLYVRDGRYIAGFQCPQTGRWRMQSLAADTLTDARHERESVIAARSHSPRTRAHEQHLVDRPRRVETAARAGVTATELARLLRAKRGCYSPWTCVAL